MCSDREKLTKGIYTELLEQCCVIESNRREGFKKEEVSALPDAEKPRKTTEKHPINLVSWGHC